MFDMIPEEILNSFAIQGKIQSLQRRLDNKRTPKKYHEPIRSEIERLEALYTERRKTEKGK